VNRQYHQGILNSRLHPNIESSHRHHRESNSSESGHRNRSTEIRASWAPFHVESGIGRIENVIGSDFAASVILAPRRTVASRSRSFFRRGRDPGMSSNGYPDTRGRDELSPPNVFYHPNHGREEPVFSVSFFDVGESLYVAMHCRRASAAPPIKTISCIEASARKGRDDRKRSHQTTNQPIPAGPTKTCQTQQRRRKPNQSQCSNPRGSKSARGPDHLPIPIGD